MIIINNNHNVFIEVMMYLYNWHVYDYNSLTDSFILDFMLLFESQFSLIFFEGQEYRILKQLET